MLEYEQLLLAIRVQPSDSILLVGLVGGLDRGLGLIATDSFIRIAVPAAQH